MLHCLSLSTCELESTLPPAAPLLLLQSQQAAWLGTIWDFRMSWREFLDPVVNWFTRQTLPTINRKHCSANVLCVESFCPQKRTTERCASKIYPSRMAPFWLLKPVSQHAYARLLPRLFYFEKNKCIYKKLLSNAHPDVCSNATETVMKLDCAAS
jgi:hypothetical protein